MFQSFEESADPGQGPARLAALRQMLAHEGLSGFLVPRADMYQGEYVAPRDDRLAWLTGFTGSAGFCAALLHDAGVFIDGRYRTQVKTQVDLDHFTPVPWPETRLQDWLRNSLPQGGVVGFDPWLHTSDEIFKLEQDLKGSAIELRPVANQVDAIWADQPDPPRGKVFVYPDDMAGESHGEKRARLAATLREEGQKAAVITLPDSLAWLLNIRGNDIPRNPVAHCVAILHDTGHLSLFIEADKLDDTVQEHLGDEVTQLPFTGFAAALRTLSGPVRVDKATAPLQVVRELEDANVALNWGPDLCILPKACKNTTEIANTKAAHLLDAAAMCEFLCWFDAQPPGSISEIDVVTTLENMRRATNALRDISFDTIAGTGPNGAVIHYRVTQHTNAMLQDGQLIVVDSGGQYLNGTTDITRTLPVGEVGAEEKTCFTRVLQGMIGISRLRFPIGLAGRDIDAIARMPLWVAGQDFNHGTGHGVGVYLCVHEGPQRISRASDVALKPGMILSNEPGYYREGAFGIRIENLIVVQPAADLDGADDRPMLDFETLTWVPIDRRLILSEMLSKAERDWIDGYHAACRDKISPRLSEAAQLWLRQATAPL
ncbi:Xaa-Pro dipeptidase [Thalassovita gelatinovora]|uniref:Xaa-Pro dipeptidase n=1 Tax=Thalassovita gelatinovora TaxID=53501 RepID=A0A0P1FE31_THAGE|nr:aminopeptidase P family protein [Thalassovita gelatinovora]QIZ79940.1 aminopeptidase P family protein [Thalassovita gelatinovora]CUH66464.1 Xaa-Pro dipeptidase [Thalassovita gelatinovora]SER13648.1 Xaa-Pro aminopeptidase [Thalassovita gelatinovora]